MRVLMCSMGCSGRLFLPLLQKGQLLREISGKWGPPQLIVTKELMFEQKGPIAPGNGGGFRWA